MPALLHTRRGRTILGFIVAILFVPVMLGITACLKTPIGDPQQGWLDPRITGAWLGGEPDPQDHSAAVWLFEPWDQTTWLVTYVGIQESNRSVDAADTENAAAGKPAMAEGAVEQAGTPPVDPGAVDLARILSSLADEEHSKIGELVFLKGWLTSIGDHRFLVLETKTRVSTITGMRPDEWWVFRVVLKNDRMQLSAIDTGVEELGEVATRGEAEAIIARHASDPDFYDFSAMLYRVPRSAYDEVSTIVARAGNPGE